MRKQRPQKQTEKATLIAVWIPKKMKDTLDHAVEAFDSDRSKYIRNALREKISRDLNAAA